MGLAPDWPHLSYCLSIQNRTHAYLDKGKALVLSKLERATAMRPLSELRVSGWILKLCLATKLQHPMERIRLPVSLCWVCSFTNRGLSIGAKNVPDRVKFTRALLQRKDWSMWFCLPLCVWVPGLSPSSWKHPLRKDLQDPLLRQAGKPSLHRQGKRASFRQEETANRPVFGSLNLEAMG